MSSDRDDLLCLLAEWVRRGQAAQRAIDEIFGLASQGHPEPPAAIVEPTTRHRPRKIAPRGQGKIHAQRKVTADLLSVFDSKMPRSAEDIGARAQRLGILVRRGYLKKRGGGYIRTEKPFTV